MASDKKAKPAILNASSHWQPMAVRNAIYWVQAAVGWPGDYFISTLVVFSYLANRRVTLLARKLEDRNEGTHAKYFMRYQAAMHNKMPDSMAEQNVSGPLRINPTANREWNKVVKFCSYSWEFNVDVIWSCTWDPYWGKTPPHSPWAETPERADTHKVILASLQFFLLPYI